jgi:hypothetical protein
MPAIPLNWVRVRSGIIFWILSSFVSTNVQAQPSSIPLNPGRIPEQILEQTNPIRPPEETLPKLNDEKLDSEQIEQIIRFAISNTAVRYPFLVNPTDKLTFTPNIFDPSQAQNYFDSDIRFANENPAIAKLTYGFFPRADQFYWVLPDNRIIFETNGWQGGVIQQGSGRDITIRQTVRFTRALSGTQTLTTLPENFAKLTQGIDPSTFTIRSTSAQAINPPGVPAAPIILNTGIDRNSPNVTIISTSNGTTNSPQGGGSNFGSLEPDNTPQILQGFPTNNIQSLFSNGTIPLREGAILPELNLVALGLSFNNPSTSTNNLGGSTSRPGLKILQPRQFDNRDLLQMMTNPFLNKTQREFHYLNSLFWSDLGVRQPIVSLRRTETSSSWQRLYISHPVNQTMISYDPKEIKATYNNRFINLGASLSYSENTGRFNWSQTVNGTVGMLLGGIFSLVDPQNLQDRVTEAKQLRDEQAKFTPLITNSTSQQRQQINQRLNTSLFYSSLASGLEQVSGNLTFSSNITPTSSDLLQVRTGLYRRTVQFIGSEIAPIVAGDNVVSLLRSSVNGFGPLTFIGTQIPRSLTGLPANESFASEVVLTAPDGRQFVQSFNSSDPNFVTVPIGIKRAEIAFDRIEISRTDRQRSKFFTYFGYVSLPSVELGWTGSSEGFNYAVTSGLWLNTAPNTVANVASNNLGTSEPAIGVYANAFLVWSSSQVERDEKNNLIAITTNSPLIRLAWNSATNSNNSSFANFSYTFSRQGQGLSFSITPGVVVSYESSRTRTVGFIQGSLDLGGGLRFRSSLELDQNTYWSLEGSQQLDPSFTVGAFIKNFREFTQGVDTREPASSYGLSLRYQVPASPASIETQVGISDGNIEVRIKGNIRFQI